MVKVGLSHSSSMDLFRCGWIHLHPAMVKKVGLSHSSSMDLFRCGWIHLHAAIVKRVSISHYSSDWIHLLPVWQRGPVSVIHSALICLEAVGSTYKFIFIVHLHSLDE